jgi:CheY-like chemotaxis protein
MARSILMLEHDEDDRYITQAVFDEHRYPIKINFVNNGDDLFSYLRHCEATKERLPSLLLLNHHSAPSSSVEIITRLKTQAGYRHIPIIVLSGSVNAQIVKECYEAGACSFIHKPVKSDETDVKIANFFRYWFETVELPN